MPEVLSTTLVVEIGLAAGETTSDFMQGVITQTIDGVRDKVLELTADKGPDGRRVYGFGYDAYTSNAGNRHWRAVFEFDGNCDWAPPEFARTVAQAIRDIMSRALPATGSDSFEVAAIRARKKVTVVRVEDIPL